MCFESKIKRTDAYFHKKNRANIDRCPGRNVPDFERMFLKLKYIDLTKNTYIRS